ncbi:MAG: spore coat protein [Bacillota bacterium]|nr:spore coat protein [Bacillota bacterium]
MTETATPEVKATFKKQLKSAIATHERITNYMIDRGLYHPHDLGKQLKMDLTVSETAFNLANQ